MTADWKPSRSPAETADVISTRVDDIFTANSVRGIITLRGKLRKMKIVNGEPDNNDNDIARNIARIIPADEIIACDDALGRSGVEQDDYQLSESPPVEGTIQHPTIDERAPREWLDHLNEHLHNKHQTRSKATQSNRLPSDGPMSLTFGDALMGPLQGLEDLRIQQEADEKTPVPIANRQHCWIKDRLDIVDKEIWCLPIAFWEDVMVGLCLVPTMANADQFRRVGLCNIERSGNQNWEEDVVFESWKALDKVTVSIV